MNCITRLGPSNMNGRIITLIFLLISAASANAQSWQVSYNTTLKFFNESDFENTLVEGENALKLASNPLEKLYTLKVLSVASNELEDYKKGLDYSKLEVIICKEESVPDSVYLGSLNNLANNYNGDQNFKDAIPVLSTIINISKRLPQVDELQIHQQYSDIGFAYYMISGLDSSIYYLTKANSKLLSIEGGAEDYLMNELTLGQVYYQYPKIELAQKTFKSLTILLEENGLVEDQVYAEALEGLGISSYSLGNLQEAEKAYELASKVYFQLGFTVKELESLNKQLALVYLKNEKIDKSDSVQKLLPKSDSAPNILVNQLSLAYKKYTNKDFLGSKQILKKIEQNLNTADKRLIAEYILLNSRVNLRLYGQANLDSIEQAIVIFTEVGKNEKIVDAIYVKSNIYQANGDEKKRIEVLSEAGTRAEKLANNDNLKYSIAVDLIEANLLLNQLAKANGIFSKYSSGTLNKEFETKLSITYAMLLQRGGYNLEAISVLEKSIASVEYPTLVTYQKVLAKTFLDIGKPKQALAIYEKIEAYLVKSGQKETIEYGETVVQLGRVNSMLGEFALAEEYYLRGIKIVENSAETNMVAFAGIYNSYAIFQQTIGNYDKAQLYYSKAKFFAKDNPNLKVDILQNLATLSQSQGEYGDAILLLSEASVTYGEIYGKKHSYYATSLQNLANAYSKNGDVTKAKKLLEEALDIDTQNGLQNSISYVNKLHNYGVVLQETKEYVKAKSVFENVLELRKKQLGDNHPDYIYSLYNMAVLLQKMQELELAKTYFKEVIEKYDFQINSFFPYLSEEEKSKYYAKIKEAFTAFQDFAIEYSNTDPSITGDLYNFQINHKAILLSASKSMRKTIALSNDAQLVKTYEEWVVLKKNLAKYYSVPVKELRLAGISIEAIESEANALEKSISLKSETFKSNVSKESITWQTVQKSLKENEASVEIIRLKKNAKNNTVWYAALIIKPQIASPEIIVFKNGVDLEGKYFKFYINSIKFKHEDNTSYTYYWQKMDKALTGYNKIYLSSDGIYNKLNVSTFFNPVSKSFILDKLSVQHVTNTGEIIEVSSPIKFDSNFNINLFGAPYFTQPSDDDAYKINPLPNTRIEIEVIDSIARLNNIESVQLLGKGANEKNIKNVESPNIIHIATHGFFLADKAHSDELYSVGDNPLMRSGLLFSGSEKYFDGDQILFIGSLEEEDGVLTALEVLNMNLSNTDLVVLSACETALGEIKNGEGVYGLQRAFVIAGAKSILMSLWKVDDQTTKELMVHYYTNLFNGENKFEALDKAQKKLKEKYNNPYYWGAFIISGN